VSNRNTFRHGDTMIAVESTPATITFGDILKAATVIRDEDENMAPWDHCDGFEHTAKPAILFSNPRERRGYCRFADGSDHYVIELPAGEDYGTFKYARQRGASRQVAAETVAAERRRTLAQLVKWYEDGWQWYGVRCRFAILGDEYEASLWGIDDAEYAERDIKVEMALDVAGQLEKAGFTVTGRPTAAERCGRTRDEKRTDLHRRLTAQNWAA
jgi:hypothetical protein